MDSSLRPPATIECANLRFHDIEQYMADFKGGSFTLSMSSSYKCGGKKKGENGAWRKVSTSPRKKSNQSASWNSTGEGTRAGDSSRKEMENGSISLRNNKRSLGGDHTRSLHMEQRLSACSDDEADLVKELHSMCSSKSEPDITKIADLDNCLVIFKSPSSDQSSATVNKQCHQKPHKNGTCPLSNSPMSEHGDQKPKLDPGSTKVKSLLPIPRSNRRSSSNTRQIKAIFKDTK